MKRKGKLEQYRQGDVFVERVSADVLDQPHKPVPRDKGRVILAYGEVTGHAHAICEPEAEMVELETGERFVSTTTGIKLVHEEHATIPLPAGTYKVTRQREYSPEAIRNVAD